MSKTSNDASLQPVIQVTGNDAVINVLFDSGARDRSRQTRCVRIPATFTHCELQFAGFETVDESMPTAPRIQGKVLLSIKSSDSEEPQPYTLAEPDYLFQDNGRKYRKAEESDIEQFRTQLKNTVCNSFTQALSAHLARADMPRPEPEFSPSMPVYRREQVERRSEAVNDARFRWVRNGLLMLITAGLAFSAVQYWPDAKDPVHVAEAKAPSLSDPHDVASQVELTRQTLKEMGLDVDKQMGDTGCLVGH